MLAVVLVATAAAGCGTIVDTSSGDADGEVAETVADWTDEWDDARDIVPPRDEWDEELPDEDDCEDILVDLREQKVAVFPAPDQALATTAEDWFETADSGFFECFGDGDRADELDRVYDELAQLAAEVDVALASIGDT